MNKENEKKQSYAPAFLAGLLIGIGAALLLTTKKGKQIMDILKGEAESVTSKILPMENTDTEDSEMTHEEILLDDHAKAKETLQSLSKAGKKIIKRYTHSN